MSHTLYRRIQNGCQIEGNEPESVEKLQEVLQDEDFVISILDKSPEEARTAFGAKGFTMTLEEAKELGAAINVANMESSELSVSDLEEISGGGIFDFLVFEHHWKMGGGEI